MVSMIPKEEENCQPHFYFDIYLFICLLARFKQASPVKLKAGLNGNLGRQRHESKFKVSCVKEHNAMSQPCLAQGFPNQESEGQVIKQLCLV